MLTWETILPSVSLAQFGGLLLGHAIYGLTVGALYTRPVGYRAARAESGRRSPRGPQAGKTRAAAASSDFMFATGIECSYPTIEHGRWRRDEMARPVIIERWQEDFELAREIGITHLRYGPPLHLIFNGPGRYDWGYDRRADGVICEDHRSGADRRPVPFRVPTWLGNFQNPEIGEALAEYAGAFAERFPWVRFYTPVNEMYVCARMSALDGLWNEQLRDEGAFAGRRSTSPRPASP